MSEENIEETPVAEEAPKKNTRAKKTEEPKAAPAPKRENPIPGSPEIDDKFPGDLGYRYNEAFSMIKDRVDELQAEIAELNELRAAISRVRPAPEPVDPADAWRQQKEIQRRIREHEDSKKAQVAAVLRDMKLL